MKTFYLEYEDEGDVTELVVDEGTVIRRFRSDLGFFESLTYGDDEFVFRYKSGSGEGTITIPSHVVFALPDLLLALSADRQLRRGIGMFGKSRLYEKKPIGQFP